MKVFILFLFFSILPFMHFGQSYVGFKTGFWIPANKSYDLSRGSEEIKKYASAGFAFFVNTEVSNVVSLGAGMGYDFHNTDFYNYTYAKGNGSSYVKEANYTYGQLTIWLYPQFNFGNKFQFYFNVGPAASILTNSNMNGYTQYNAGYPGDTSRFTQYDGTASAELAHVSFCLIQTLGFQYNVAEKWYLFAELYGMISSVPIISSDSNATLDLKVNIGFIYRFSNKRLENKPSEKN